LFTLRLNLLNIEKLEKDESMLILDLDDTIFETKSINPRIFDSATLLIKSYYDQNGSTFKSEEIISDLWSFPIDVVFAKYKTKQSLISEFYRVISEIEFQELNIELFEDYKELRKIKKEKVLVTTGLKELQLAKIKALGIENDFSSIHIDDPRSVPRKHKIDIFREIHLGSKKAAHELWVIGDNPESEIKAGKSLGMRTIQRKSINKDLSEFADYKIDSFKELKGIL
jgi:putative hydrolase of the HAD superfamily